MGRQRPGGIASALTSDVLIGLRSKGRLTLLYKVGRDSISGCLWHLLVKGIQP